MVRTARSAGSALRARLLAAAVAASASFAVHGGVPTFPECIEGSDFIANAARARDNGMQRATFLARMEEDFVVIRAFPPALRWFAKDDDDEAFLMAAAARVYDRPRLPEDHHSEFLASCLTRSTT